MLKYDQICSINLGKRELRKERDIALQLSSGEPEQMPVSLTVRRISHLATTECTLCLAQDQNGNQNRASSSEGYSVSDLVNYPNSASLSNVALRPLDPDPALVDSHREHARAPFVLRGDLRRFVALI